MPCCRPSARTAAKPQAPRGVTLIEVMVAQVIALILIAGLMSLVVVMTRAMHGEAGTADAQVRLRQASHVLLRDAQGLGGDIGDAGDLLRVVDGDNDAPDEFGLFRFDAATCIGGLGVTSRAGVVLSALRPDGTCPIEQPGCLEVELLARRLLVVGNGGAIVLAPTDVDGTACTVTFNSNTTNDEAVPRYADDHDLAATTVEDVFESQELGGGALSMVVGNRIDWRINGTVLERRINDADWSLVLDDIFDLQIERVYDLDDDRLVDPGEAFATNTLPADANAENFLGVRIGIIAFAPSAQGVASPPPLLFSNRDHGAAPTDRRYRASWLYASARNRAGP